MCPHVVIGCIINRLEERRVVWGRGGGREKLKRETFENSSKFFFCFSSFLYPENDFQKSFFIQKNLWLLNSIVLNVFYVSIGCVSVCANVEIHRFYLFVSCGCVWMCLLVWYIEMHRIFFIFCISKTQKFPRKMLRFKLAFFVCLFFLFFLSATCIHFCGFEFVIFFSSMIFFFIFENRELLCVVRAFLFITKSFRFSKVLCVWKRN